MKTMTIESEYYGEYEAEYLSEKSAPGHPLCDDKSVKKFLEQIKQYK